MSSKWPLSPLASRLLLTRRQGSQNPSSSRDGEMSPQRSFKQPLFRMHHRLLFVLANITNSGYHQEFRNTDAHSDVVLASWRRFSIRPICISSHSTRLPMERGIERSRLHGRRSDISWLMTAPFSVFQSSHAQTMYHNVSKKEKLGQSAHSFVC